jgi:hypothetical protein
MGFTTTSADVPQEDLPCFDSASVAFLASFFGVVDWADVNRAEGPSFPCSGGPFSVSSASVPMVPNRQHFLNMSSKSIDWLAIAGVAVCVLAVLFLATLAIRAVR